MRVAILISGRGSNMERLVDSCKINNKSASIELVFSNNDKASGLYYAKNNNIKTSVIDHRIFEKREDFDHELDKKLRENNIDFICNAGFMRILSEDFVNNWFNKQLNIHPSLLPDFKGLDVHKRVIESKTNISGCTVHLVRAGVDEGPIIGQISTKVESNDNEEILASKILKLEHILYPVCLKLFSDNLIQINEDKIIYSKGAIDQLDKINARLGK
jgi:phosphoribosylglycinamide formyltransferase-1